jgi:hypothetical protein
MLLINVMKWSSDPQTWYYRENVYDPLYDPLMLKLGPLIDELIDKI